MLQLRKSIVGRVARRGLLDRASISRMSRCFLSSTPAETSEPKVPTIKTSDILENPQADSKRISNQKRVGKKHNLNYKLREISMQIRQSVAEAKNDMSETLDVLEEGLAYLREVQHVENISEEALFSLFQPILYDVLSTSLKDSVSTGNRSLHDILDLFIEMRVAHQIHFTALFSHELSSAEVSIEMYQNLLGLWVKFLEYKKTNENPLITKYFGFMRLRNITYFSSDLTNLAFYVYVLSCMIHGIKYSVQDAQKLLQIDNLPHVSQVRRTITSLNLTKATKTDFPKFNKALNEYSMENLDPNGSLVMNRVNSAIAHNDVNTLNRIFDQIKEASTRNNIKIKESTLVKMMDGYYECKSFENVFEIFESMLSNGVGTPTTNSWEFLFKSMAHPSHIRGFDAKRKEETAHNIERAMNTMLESGLIMTPKALSVIVGGFANLDRFDLVDKYVEEYAITGKGSIPIIHSTRNNILIGYLINKRIEEAERKLQEFMKEDPNFKPSSTTMNTFLNHYARGKNYDAVDGILKFMTKNNIPQEIATYTIVIDIYFKLHREQGLSPNVDQLLGGILNSKTITLNDYTFTSLIDGLVKDGTNLEAARIMFDFASKKYRNSAQLYTSMLKGELDYGSVGNAELIFDKYINGIRNDARIWNMMINSLLTHHENLAVSYYNKFKEQSKYNGAVKPNYYTYYFLFKHFIRKDNSQMIQFLLDEIATMSLNEMGFELPKILRSLSKRYRIDERLLLEIAK